jgi:hypothetical protein
MLFCQSLQPVCFRLTLLKFSYLDDLTVGDKISAVATDVLHIVDVRSRMSLHLYADKCELFCHQGIQVTDPLLASFQRTSVEDATLLGAPFFRGAEVDRTWS